MTAFAIVGAIVMCAVAYMAWIVEHDTVQVIIVTCAVTVLLVIVTLVIFFFFGMVSTSAA